MIEEVVLATVILCLSITIISFIILNKVGTIISKIKRLEREGDSLYKKMNDLHIIFNKHIAFLDTYGVFHIEFTEGEKAEEFKKQEFMKLKLFAQKLSEDILWYEKENESLEHRIEIMSKKRK